MNFPTCTFISSYTSIQCTRVQQSIAKLSKVLQSIAWYSKVQQSLANFETQFLHQSDSLDRESVLAVKKLVCVPANLMIAIEFWYVQQDEHHEIQVVLNSNLMIKTDRKRMLLLNDCYTTVSGHFFAMCMFIFHKTEVQTVSLRYLTDLNPNLFKNYDQKPKYFHFPFFVIL